MMKTKSSPSQRGSNFIYQALPPSLGLSKVFIGCCVKMSKNPKSSNEKNKTKKQTNKKQMEKPLLLQLRLYMQSEGNEISNIKYQISSN